MTTRKKKRIRRKVKEEKKKGTGHAGTGGDRNAEMQRFA